MNAGEINLRMLAFDKKHAQIERNYKTYDGNDLPKFCCFDVDRDCYVVTVSSSSEEDETHVFDEKDDALKFAYKQIVKFYNY
jgi:hypothetical protein